VAVKTATSCICGEVGTEPARRQALDDATLEQVVRFHGRMCPGLAMGVHAADIALREIGGTQRRGGGRRGGD